MQLFLSHCCVLLQCLHNLCRSFAKASIGYSYDDSTVPLADNSDASSGSDTDSDSDFSDIGWYHVLTVLVLTETGQAKRKSIWLGVVINRPPVVFLNHFGGLVLHTPIIL